MYKLIYFNFRARAEPIRLILALKGIPYEDIRIDKENWPEHKNSFTWGQLPALEIEGEGRILQSIAITRYLARKYNLIGANEYEAAKCDEYVDALSDIRIEWKKFFFEEDKPKQDELKKMLLEIHFPNYFGKFESMSKESTSPYLVGKQLTWADLLMAHTLEYYQNTVDPNFANNYTNLLKLKESVYKIPEIETWIQSRPETAR